jgi:TonB family protein
MQGAYTSLAPKEVRDGHFIYYTESGVKTRDEYFKEGLKEGEGMSYDTTGHYTYKMHFKKGKLEDTLTGYYPSGALRRTEIYINDSLVSGNCYDEKGNNIAFIPRIVNLEYPGGDMAMMRFIQHHIKYRDFARKNDIQGHVLVSFILDTAGNVTEIGIKKSVHPLLDKAAIDVVRKLPKFKPSEYEGKIVPTNCILTVMFKLSSR